MNFFHHKVKFLKSIYDVLVDENKNKKFFGQPYFYTRLTNFFIINQKIFKAFMMYCSLKTKIKYFWTTSFLHKTENQK
jgi:hypothetical protein